MNDEPLHTRVSEVLGLHHADFLASNAGILTAWSGGLDSTVLLHVLKKLANRHGFELFAVHLDHNLRPCSASDAAWCRREAARLGIGIHIEHLMIRPGSSTQNQARAQRYAALFNVANTLKLPFLATAHHADDAIETALINFARGTSLKGLTSLAAEFSSSSHDTTPANFKTTRLIRPLLDCTRAELERYAADHHLAWREDPSNRSDHYERNRIRQHVVPQLIEKPHQIAQLQTSLEHLREDSNALDQIARNLFQQARLPQGGLQTIAIDRPSIAAEPSSIITRVLKQAHPGWNRATLNAALKTLHEPTNRNTFHKISLIGATAIFRNDCIIIEPTIGRGPRELDQRTAHSAHFDITTPGEFRWFDTQIAWQKKPYDQHAINYDSEQIVYFDADLLPSTIFIRGPAGNERLAAEPPTGRKRIKDLWREHAIPSDVRWRWPCLVARDNNNNEEILWLCKLRRSNKYQINAQTRVILIVSCSSASTTSILKH